MTGAPTDVFMAQLQKKDYKQIVAMLGKHLYDDDIVMATVGTSKPRGLKPGHSYMVLALVKKG